MTEKIVKILCSILVLLCVGIFGWAHGNTGRGKAPSIPGGVVLGLCREERGHGSKSGDVPQYPGSGGMSVTLNNGDVIHYSAVDASVRMVIDYYNIALAEDGWKKIDVPSMTEPFILWFRKGGRECIASFSENGPKSTHVILITN